MQLLTENMATANKKKWLSEQQFLLVMLCVLIWVRKRKIVNLFRLES